MRVLGQASPDVRRGHQRLARQPAGRGHASEVVRQLAAMLAARAATHPFAPGFAGGFTAPTAGAATASSIIATGWDAIDCALAPASPRDIDSDALAHVGMGGLARGVMHEWLCGETLVRDHGTVGVRATDRQTGDDRHIQAPFPPVSRGTDSPQSARSIMRGRWLSPHSLFIHLAWRAIEAEVDSDSSSSGLVIWIGRRVWPQAQTLRRSMEEFTTEMGGRRHGEGLWGWERAHSARRGVDPRRRVLGMSSNSKSQIPFSALSVSSVPCLRGAIPSSSIQNRLLDHSIFIDPPDDASRLWGIDLALRSPAASVVIADGSKLKMSESRRLQLAAKRGRALALLARPAWEGSELSAAATRWRVHRTPSSSSAPRWIVELLRCKHHQGRSGLQAFSTSPADGGGRGQAWEVEYASPGCLRLVADVVDRSGSPHETARVSTLSLA